ncbi:hypothetical protein D9615_010517 [Tricholomella constricta]|uniref:F-box domain-containing protein n=1 Tax=Tricholomella constricta TaxID=117010 RepID=A0A8H5GP02_9AGAR|nr:hypothetical protein D9615_010517 [Tricholomella constricta]
MALGLPPMAARLPSELLHLILEHLDDLPKTLQSCALISHTWYPTSQAHIFHTVLITKKSQCQRLNNHLALWPHILPHIHRLSLHISPSPDCAPETQLLRLLTHTGSSIQSLTLHLAWQKLAPDVRNALILLLQRPTLASLFIHCSSFDIDGDFLDILSASSVKRLSLLGLLCFRKGTGASSNLNPNQPEASFPVPRFKTDIKELTISPQYNNSPAMIEWFLSPRCTLSLAQLQALHIMHCDHLNSSLPSGLLKLAGSALTQFSFKATEFQIDTQAPDEQMKGWEGINIDFSHNPSLRYVAFALPGNNWRGFGPPQWIETALATLAPTAHIEKLELRLIVDPPRHASSSILDPPVDPRLWNDSMSAWARLLSATRSSALGCVRLVLAYDIARSGELNVGMAIKAIKESAEWEMRRLLGESKSAFVLEGRRVEFFLDLGPHPVYNW